MGNRIADGFLALQAGLAQTHGQLYGAGTNQMLSILSPQLLKATGCECMKVWVYLLLHIPDRNELKASGLAVAVADVLGVIDAGYEQARDEAVAGTQLAMHGTKPDKDHDASRVKSWADAMLVMTYGNCPNFECPTADKPTPVFTDAVMQALGVSATPKVRQGPYGFNGNHCYVVEFVSPVGAKGASVDAGAGVTVTLQRQLKFVLRYVFCFYNTAPPNVPPSPTDPRASKGKGPGTGGPDPLPPPPPPSGPTTPQDTLPLPPVGPTRSTGRGRRRRPAATLTTPDVPRPEILDDAEDTALTHLVFAGTFRRKWPSSPRM